MFQLEPLRYLFFPDLQRLAADAVQDGQETRLECVFEHSAAPAVDTGVGNFKRKVESSPVA